MNIDEYGGGYGGAPNASTTEITSRPRYEVDPTIHKWMFSNEDVLKEIERSLRGQTYDRKQKKWIQVLKPLLNDDGINMIIYILKPYTSTLFSFSQFSDKEISFTMMQFMEDLIPLLATECENFGIDENHLSIVKRVVEDTIYATLKKAEGGLSLGFLRDTQKTVETVGDKRSGFSLFGLFNKGNRR